ncbi:hypothetical protein DFH05DRAFT_1501495 [Lentinula detonsa]|uniref:Uncharacterized protein n=1 Tax=Lentinula detonsa TaxID=2804962 RepID=A0A9W8TW45_9AGAR|nr:hypothetical protein DFH05DRAFT_1501495 [Lentinula detonsa]
MLLPSFDKLAFVTLFGLTNLAIVKVGAMPPRSRTSSPSPGAHSPVSSVEPDFKGYAYEFKDSPGKYLDYSTLTMDRVAVYSKPRLDTVDVLRDCWKCLVYDKGFFTENQLRLVFAPPRIADNRDAISNYLQKKGFHGDPESAILVQEHDEGDEVMLIPQAILKGQSTLEIRCPKQGESDYKKISNTKEAVNWNRLRIKNWDENPKYLTVDYPNRRPHSPTK